MKVKNTLNAALFAKDYEANDMPSMTIPDQSMTVREIIDRHTRGIPFEAGKVPVYNEDEYWPEYKKMDLTEREELKQKAQDTIDNYRKQSKKQKDEEVNKKAGDVSGEQQGKDEDNV